MGYGHQRTAHALQGLAFDKKIINVNDYEGIPAGDRKMWEGMRKFYEFISNLYRIPFIGRVLFAAFDRFQKILAFYPKRDLSKPNVQLKQMYSFLQTGWGRDLIGKLKTQNSKLKTDLPVISTFFTPAFMAEFFHYPGNIYCVVCDADISRTWAPLNPQESKIKYFAPTERAAERLKVYGVRQENIFFTGYPLPQELIGSEAMEVAKEDFRYRLLNLDPQKKCFEKYRALIEEKVGVLPEQPDHLLTIVFSVGGAGAQKEIGAAILHALGSKLKEGTLRLVLSAGTKEHVKDYFEKHMRKNGLAGNKNVEVIFERDIESYFQKFNQALKKTDVLWTKPSELSFYAALGIPIIIAPPIGSQEEFNETWLIRSGFGIPQENPNYVGEWLFDWLKEGYLAETAMHGFIKGEKLGIFHIERIISSKG